MPSKPYIEVMEDIDYDYPVWQGYCAYTCTKCELEWVTEHTTTQKEQHTEKCPDCGTENTTDINITDPR